MSDKSDHEAKARTLRRAVEKRIADDPAPAVAGGEPDPVRLLHELRVHQIELEIQNDALRDAHLEAEDSLARYLSLYEHAPVAYVTLGGDGTILQVNRAARTLLGLTGPPADPIRLGALVAEPSLPAVSRFLDQILAGEHVPGVEATLRPAAPAAGGTVILEGLPDPRGSGGLIALIDITERRRAQEELKRAKDEADRASAAKTRFLGAVSHDLRQPLQTLYLLSGVLSRHVLDAKGQDLIAGLDQALEAMTGMLTILLDINEIESGVVQPKPRAFHLDVLFGQLLRDFAYTAQAKGVALRQVGCRHVVHTDQGLLAQILRNLLSNAIKYTHHGKVLLGVRRRGGTVRIEIWDTGIGIPPDQLDAIFEEFHQINNPARERRHGLGLGLAIVRRQASLLGHPVGVRSRLGHGTVFWIEVPVADLAAIPDGVAAQPGEQAEGRLVGRTVLVVENDVAIVALLEGLLVAEGALVTSAPDGTAALDRLGALTDPPDLLVTDYTLPSGMSGLDVVDAVRAAMSSPVPAIVLTGDISSGPAHALAERPGCIRLLKPVTAGALLAVIPGLLSPAAAPPAARAALPAQDPTVFVVDDDTALLVAMTGLLSERGWAVERYTDAETFLASVSPDRRGCVIVDAVMPGMGGVALLQRLQSAGSRLAAIVMTGHGDVAMAVAAMKAGASDFIAKPAAPSDLLALVERALHPERGTEHDSPRRGDAIRRVAGLTPREREVLDLLLAGHPNKVVAHALTISQRTVENHRATIMRKTGSRTLLDLFRTVLDAGACPPSIAPLPPGRAPAPR